ncbi:FimV/HubP family polar landmark protein [Stenotrophomonas sp. HITSZ_GD]|uniref:type IV pilus assembly protein FimV n=1 Tax=Stenotrophomonas sp. HITSZ_GD TaxID=3037248 RepID=UPI00240E0C67|nr:FimV/HubP family polar landmark protein [Stenotrophomonas sp. HITSZ_GD]MDG2524516.1 FimV/HubP family polar landmark protein [Stenotrophomonas sp. HITSZ_GD]
MGARRPLQGIGALVLTLCSGAAMALGLGDIRVLSRPGQPLVAEIPVISNEPGELENAHVALASPATFARVGLAPPQGLVNELQFQFTQDAGGRAVIRVTSALPVSQQALSFLIEVDWGQGRLVREYSALVDAPNTAAAIAEPMIQAPAASAENRIIRETEALPPEPAAAPETPAPEAGAPVAPAVAPAPAPRPVRQAPTAPALSPGDALTVRSGQTLSGIAAQLAREGGTTLDQTMVALLRANPDAFIGGNINRLKAGAVLRTPAQEELARVGAAEARAMVQEQAAQWRQARAAIPQPAEAGAAATPAPTPASTPASPAVEGARLEIAPAVASDAKNAGTTSGTGAGGEGDMAANEQLQQAREDIATRDAEIQELRTRVGELEKLKQDQQKLIAMKDSDLAAAQARLAKAGTQPAAEAGTPMWLWGGLALLLAGVAAWLASRRRKPSPLPPLPRHGFDAAALAAAVPGAEAPSVGEREVDREVELEEVDLREEEHAAWRAPAEEIPEPVIVPEPEPVAPAWHADALAPLNPVPAGRDRLELAVAYLDLGDTETARSLLLEVAQGPDAEARAEAVALLGQLR